MIAVADPCGGSNALIAVAGTLLGSLLTGTMGFVSRRGQHQYEDATRFEEIRVPYAEFLDKSGKVAVLARSNSPVPDDLWEVVDHSFQTISSLPHRPSKKWRGRLTAGQSCWYIRPKGSPFTPMSAGRLKPRSFATSLEPRSVSPKGRSGAGL
jgi:hypothetical protein